MFGEAFALRGTLRLSKSRGLFECCCSFFRLRSTSPIELRFWLNMPRSWLFSLFLGPIELVELIIEKCLLFLLSIVR